MKNNKRNINVITLLIISLIGLISCIEGDLYDLYEDSNLDNLYYIKRSKQWSDNAPNANGNCAIQCFYSFLSIKKVNYDVEHVNKAMWEAEHGIGTDIGEILDTYSIYNLPAAINYSGYFEGTATGSTDVSSVSYGDIVGIKNTTTRLINGVNIPIGHGTIVRSDHGNYITDYWSFDWPKDTLFYVVKCGSLSKK